jgi:hypothetical protein
MTNQLLLTYKMHVPTPDYTNERKKRRKRRRKKRGARNADGWKKVQCKPTTDG